MIRSSHMVVSSGERLLWKKCMCLVAPFPSRDGCLLNTGRDTPQESTHIIDGHVYVDPKHAKVRNEKDKRIATAHYYYPEPLGGRHVWYSKESLSGGVSSSAYWVYEGPV